MPNNIENSQKKINIDTHLNRWIKSKFELRSTTPTNYRDHVSLTVFQDSKENTKISSHQLFIAVHFQIKLTE